jgi:hypothetical protein
VKAAATVLAGNDGMARAWLLLPFAEVKCTTVAISIQTRDPHGRGLPAYTGRSRSTHQPGETGGWPAGNRDQPAGALRAIRRFPLYGTNHGGFEGGISEAWSLPLREHQFTARHTTSVRIIRWTRRS